MAVVEEPKGEETKVVGQTSSTCCSVPYLGTLASAATSKMPIAFTRMVLPIWRLTVAGPRRPR
eukprot:10965862-Lingulodinium_polyedra.AAC.1